MAARGRVYLLSLGCAKNLVESERMSGLLTAYGWRLVSDPAQAEVIVVNTCGFIQAAKEEAISHILTLAAYKETGCCQLLVAVGCMVEKYRQEMAAALPEIDAFLGSHQVMEIGDLLAARANWGQRPDALPRDLYLLRQRATPPYTAYLKIADGCNNCCSYCLIPQLRGPLVSRPSADIVAEARQLAAAGVKELVVIAQDITAYGLDWDGKSHLPDLLLQLTALPFPWIRLLYAYPNRLEERLLSVIQQNQNICRYLDLPLQHIDDTVLAAMNRQGGAALIREKVALLRRFVPDMVLRTTMMVGFPGESKAAFQKLLAFLAEGHFQWVGAFAYCREQDTSSYCLPQQKDRATKERRLAKVMDLMAGITAEQLQRFVGRTLEVMVEEVDEPQTGWYSGRSQYQAPEVDGLIYFNGPAGLEPGMMAPVRIVKVDVYDLVGEMVE